MEYFCQAAQTIMLTKAGGKKVINGKTIGTTGSEDFIGLKPED